MTVLEICVELLKWFQENDSFSLEKDFKKVILISEDEYAEKAVLLAGLKKLEKQELITGVTLRGENIYILNKKIDSYDQDITIDQSTALKVASVINSFCDSIKDYKDVADPASITQQDILHLALILESWQKQNSENSLDG
jgi:hypothetical protein